MPQFRKWVRLRPAALALLIAGASSNAVARAHDLDVQWDVPARDCPDREQLRAGLAERLGRPLSFGPDARLRLRARIVARDGGYQLQLATRSDQTSDERTLNARTCNELLRASVLIAALSFGQRPLELEPPAPKPARSETRESDAGAADDRSLVRDPGIVLVLRPTPGALCTASPPW